MTHRPFLSLPLRSMQPFCLREDSSLFSVASETLSLFAKISLVIDRFCFMAERTACCRLLTGSVAGSFTGSVAGSFWIWSVNFTCMSSGCSNNSGLTQCFSTGRVNLKLVVFALTFNQTCQIISDCSNNFRTRQTLLGKKMTTFAKKKHL